MRSLVTLLLILCSLAAACAQPKIRVAVYVDKGAHPRPQLVDSLKARPDMDVETIKGPDIRRGVLDRFDVLIVPGGVGRLESVSMEAAGRARVIKFVEHGGLYMGICAGAYLASAGRPIDLHIMPAVPLDAKHWRRGKAVLPVGLTPLGQDVFGVQKNSIDVLYHNGPILGHAPNDAEVLGTFEKEIVGKGGERGIMRNAPAMLLYRKGEGIVLTISPHPEGTPGLENLEPHAVRWMYDHRSGW